MDNLKLLGKSEEELQKQIKTVTNFSDDIRMEFGLDKCADIVFNLLKPSGNFTYNQV
jgi:hypothetical protein